MKIGSKVKNFSAEMTGNKKYSLKEFTGKNIVLYFYPRDNTPGCTSESISFRDNFKSFQKKNTLIFGISKDSLSSQEKFKEKFNFPFELISDPEEKVCKAFDVIKEKSMYGKKYLGIERSTFLFKNKKMIKEWRKVKVNGHASEVLNYINNL